MADEYGLTACGYEMKRTRALIKSDLTAEEQYRKIENNAMDKSLKHLTIARRLYRERYDSSGLIFSL